MIAPGPPMVVMISHSSTLLVSKHLICGSDPNGVIQETTPAVSVQGTSGMYEPLHERNPSLISHLGSTPFGLTHESTPSVVVQ